MSGRRAFDTGGPQGPPPFSASDSASGDSRAGVSPDLDRLAGEARLRVSYSEPNSNMARSAEAVLALIARVRVLEATLAFYADERTYEESVEPHPTQFATGIVPIQADSGSRARSALAVLGGDRPHE